MSRNTPTPPTNTSASACAGALAGRRAERLALALLNDDVPPELRADAREALRLANAERAVHANATALAAFRSGQQVQAWPAKAPWAGFSDARAAV